MRRRARQMMRRVKQTSEMLEVLRNCVCCFRTSLQRKYATVQMFSSCFELESAKNG